MHKTAPEDEWDELPAVFGFHPWADIAKSGDFPLATIRMDQDARFLNNFECMVT